MSQLIHADAPPLLRGPLNSALSGAVLITATILVGVVVLLLPDSLAAPELLSAAPALLLPGPKVWLMPMLYQPDLPDVRIWGILLVPIAMNLVGVLRLATRGLADPQHSRLLCWTRAAAAAALLGLLLLLISASFPQRLPGRMRWWTILGFVLAAMEIPAWAAAVWRSGHLPQCWPWLPRLSSFAASSALIGAALMGISGLISTSRGFAPWAATWPHHRQSPVYFSACFLLMAGGAAWIVAVWPLLTCLYQLRRTSQSEAEERPATRRGLALLAQAVVALLAVALWGYGMYRHWGPAEANTIEFPRQYPLFLSTDGQSALISNGPTLRAIDLASGRTVGQLENVDRRTVSFSADARFAAVCIPEDFDNGALGRLSLWDINERKLRRQFDLATAESWIAPPIAVSLDGRRILCPNSDELLLFEADQPSVTRRIPAPSASTLIQLVFSPNPRFVIAGDSAGFCRIWDIEAGSELFATDPTGSPITAIGLGPSDRFFLVASKDGSATIRSISTGQSTGLSLHSVEGWFTAAAISADEKRVLTGGIDGRVILWESATGKELARFSRHRSAIVSVAFQPATGQAISASLDGTIRQWYLPP